MIYGKQTVSQKKQTEPFLFASLLMHLVCKLFPLVMGLISLSATGDTAPIPSFYPSIQTGVDVASLVCLVVGIYRLCKYPEKYTGASLIPFTLLFILSDIIMR
jgi:hypothetical protein